MKIPKVLFNSKSTEATSIRLPQIVPINLAIADGLTGFGTALQALPKDSELPPIRSTSFVLSLTEIMSSAILITTSLALHLQIRQ